MRVFFFSQSFDKIEIKPRVTQFKILFSVMRANRFLGSGVTLITIFNCASLNENG